MSLIAIHDETSDGTRGIPNKGVLSITKKCETIIIYRIKTNICYKIRWVSRTRIVLIPQAILTVNIFGLFLSDSRRLKRLSRLKNRKFLFEFHLKKKI
jgi:hypothetical protein